MAWTVLLIILLASSGASGTRLHLRHGSLRRVSFSAQEDTELMNEEKPATLADYCKSGGGDPGFEEKQRVEADWGDYGEFYPGKISDVNKNGTVDVHYEDGWKEKNVEQQNVKVVKQKAKKLDDAACEVVDALEDVKKKVEETERDVKLYMMAKEAQVQGVDRPRLPPRPGSHKGKGRGSPAPAPWYQPPAGLIPMPNASWLGASPAPAPVSNARPKPIAKEKSKELDKLREELAALDDTIRELREEIANNDRLITGEWEDEEDLDDDGVLSIDELIEQFRDRIAERKEELEKLRARRKAQDAQLARVGASPVSLESIRVHAKEILSDIEEMKAKRDQLEKEDKLDPELGTALEALIEQGEALDGVVSAMIEAERRAERLRKAAEAARREAAESRRKARAAARKAREETERRLMDEAKQKAKKSEDPVETMKEAQEQMKKMAKAVEDEANAREEATLQQQENAAAAQEAVAAVADARALEAGEGVRSSLDVVKSGTRGMDTDVHPNGEKWWRYRYEHSFVEGLLAILVCFLIMCWECFLRSLRGWLIAASDLKDEEVFAHQSLYQHWLDHFLTEMVACLLMFLTVWLVGHFGFFDVFPMYFEGHHDLHLPTTGHEYRVLAYEICVILTFSLILYFCLAISVVHAATAKVARWRRAEIGMPVSGETEQRAITHTITITGGEVSELERYFVKMITQEDPEAIDVHSFSIWRYLLIAVRGTVDSMLVFGPLNWMAVILTFGVFLVLHAYAHVAFIRIMTFFLAVLMVTLAVMAWAVISVNRASNENIEEFSESTRTPRPKPKTHHKHQSWVIFALLTYSVFFLCYGASRTLLQPWLWKLYFYTLLFVAGFSLLMCLVFAFSIAPLIPTYSASLALPPYVDIAHVKSLKEALRDDRIRS